MGKLRFDRTFGGKGSEVARRNQAALPDGLLTCPSAHGVDVMLSGDGVRRRVLRTGTFSITGRLGDADVATVRSIGYRADFSFDVLRDLDT